MHRNKMIAGVAGAILLASGLVISRAQDPVDEQLPVSDPICTFFGPDHDKFIPNLKSGFASQANLTVGVSSRVAMAAEVVAAAGLPSVPGGSRSATLARPSSNTIDKYIFPALSVAGVAPAPPTTDFEFIRRVYLDLTGHIPTPQQVVNFVTDTAPDKRSKLVDSLIGSPDWVDKWTMWFGDFYQNNSRNSQIQRAIQGVMAFNNYIRTSLQNNKPYDQMARELMANPGTDSYVQGELNYLVGGVVTGGPNQDIFDQQIANVATNFLGLSNLNCVLCHDGRGHLDQLNLWGYYTTRKQAWNMAAFMAHTNTARLPGQQAEWNLQDTRVVDYQLNTQTGNRPPRGATNSSLVMKPMYLTGETPRSGENYRAALGRMITSDFQFSRATVNYVWEYFFNLGLVTPSNQFDLMRLDPDNPPSNCPPSTPCTLQPSNARLLNALAQDFIDSGYDLRALMREIVTSQTYQLSSRYDGNWDSTTANLFGRHLVRRLWGEEIHDAIAQSSGILPTYNNPTWGPVQLAMKLPEPLQTPDGNGAVSQFLDSFLRGNRDDQSRRPDGSISQALGLLNDNFVVSRVLANANNGLVKFALTMPDDEAVKTLFMFALSRVPTGTEMNAALANLKTNRTLEMQNLLWSLYNKVDFVFNY